MKTKILVINMKRPNESKYRKDCFTAAACLLGCTVKDYVVMFISEHRKEIVPLGSSCDVSVVCDSLEVALEAFEESVKESEY
jgi:hypothetical protein